MLERLTQLKSTLDNSGVLTKSDKEFIKQTYFEIMGVEAPIKTKCRSCWNDALIVLIIKLSPKKIRMRYGCVETLDGVHYNHRNITDEIALEIMRINPNSKSSFYGL